MTALVYVLPTLVAQVAGRFGPGGREREQQREIVVAALGDSIMAGSPFSAHA